MFVITLNSATRRKDLSMWNIKAVLRDAAIIFILTALSGAVVGIYHASLGGDAPIPAREAPAIAFGNIAFTTVGFIISGCLSKKHRFKHGLRVTLALWILSLGNVFLFGVTLASWIISPVVILPCMVVGVGISFLFAKTPKESIDEAIGISVNPRL